MKRQIYIDGMLGIGDNIMERPFIKALVKTHNVWLKTATPEIFCDIPGVHFVKSNTKLRTQRKNEQRSNAVFSEEPKAHVPRKRIFYGNADLQLPGGIFESARRQFGVTPEKLDLPSYKMPEIGGLKGRKIALIRPTTERTEWHNAARGPLNYHVNEVALLLRSMGYLCISIADVEAGKEWIPDEEPYADIKLHHGELSLTEMLSVVENSSIVVTGSGIISQAALAYRTPMIFLGGGCGGSNHHTKITDPEIMDLGKCLFLYPDNYCMCQHMRHDCNKRISNVRKNVEEWLNVQNL